MTAIAVIPTDLAESRLGLRSRVTDRLAAKSVLRHTLERVAKIAAVERIVLLHPPGQAPLAAVEIDGIGKPVVAFADPTPADPWRAMRRSARAWALTAWRGGLGGATCYDELLPAAAIHAALKANAAEAALLVGADWVFVDPDLSNHVLELHLKHPDAMQLTFTQAPPGLVGIAAGAKVLSQLADAPSAMIGHLFGYVPSRPQPDPIGRDLCVQIDHAIRSCPARFIYDTPRAAALIDAVAARLGPSLDAADPKTITALATPLLDEVNQQFLPQQVSLELTPRRSLRGPILPQFHLNLNRPDMDTDRAVQIVNQLGAAGDTVLTLGGLGDALLHPHWDRVVLAARHAGVLAICVETDLLADRAVLGKLVDLPIDVVGIRINADRAANYERVMGENRFAELLDNVQWLFAKRHERWQTEPSRHGLPWLVARMVKTTDTLPDLEAFFDKWTHVLGHAVIEPATTGCGLMPEQSPVNMAGPRRKPCRQIERRLTIHSDGRIARCDQDWLARAPAGDATVEPLSQAWTRLQAVRSQHHAGEWSRLDLCSNCSEWHRP